MTLYHPVLLLVGCLLSVSAISENSKQSVLVYFEDLTEAEWSSDDMTDVFKMSVADILDSYCCGGDTEYPNSCGLDSCSDTVDTSNVEILASHSYSSELYVVKTSFNLMDGTGLMEQSLFKDILYNNMALFDDNFASYPVRFIMCFNYDLNIIMISLIMIFFIILLVVTYLLNWNQERTLSRARDAHRVNTTSDHSLVKSGGSTMTPRGHQDVHSVPEVLYLPPPPPPPPRDSSHRREKAIKRVRSEMEREQPPGTGPPPANNHGNNDVKMKAPLLESLTYEDEMAPPPPTPLELKQKHKRHHRSRDDRVSSDQEGTGEEDGVRGGGEGGEVRHRKRHQKKKKNKDRSSKNLITADGSDGTRPTQDAFLMNNLSGTDPVQGMNLPPVEARRRDLPPIVNHSDEVNY